MKKLKLKICLGNLLFWGFNGSSSASWSRLSIFSLTKSDVGIIYLFSNVIGLIDFFNKFSFALLWILVSYVLGRYHSPNSQKNEYIFLIFLKTIFTSFFVATGLLIVNLTFNIEEINLIINNFKFNNYLVFICLSFFVRFIFDYLYITKLHKKLHEGYNLI